jgi:hypothetical protein
MEAPNVRVKRGSRILLLLGAICVAAIVPALILSRGHTAGCEHAVGLCEPLIMVTPSWRGPVLASLTLLALVAFSGAWILTIAAPHEDKDE